MMLFNHHTAEGGCRREKLKNAIRVGAGATAAGVVASFFPSNNSNVLLVAADGEPTSSTTDCTNMQFLDGITADIDRALKDVRKTAHDALRKSAHGKASVDHKHVICDNGQKAALHYTTKGNKSAANVLGRFKRLGDFLDLDDRDLAKDILVLTPSSVDGRYTKLQLTFESSNPREGVVQKHFEKKPVAVVDHEQLENLVGEHPNLFAACDKAARKKHGHMEAYYTNQSPDALMVVLFPKANENKFLLVPFRSFAKVLLNGDAQQAMQFADEFSTAKLDRFVSDALASVGFM